MSRREEPTQRLEVGDAGPRARDYDDRYVERQPAASRGTEPYAAAPAGNGTAVAAFVLGMLAVTFAFLVLPFIAAILFGLIALFMGISGAGKANRLGGLNKGLAITGAVTGLLGLLLGVAILLAGRAAFNQLQNNPQLQRTIQQQFEDAQN